MFYLRVRQNSKVEHTVTLPIDVITSASTDAIDATTSASRHNEAGTLQVETRTNLPQRERGEYRLWLQLLKGLLVSCE